MCHIINLWSRYLAHSSRSKNTASTFFKTVPFKYLCEVLVKQYPKIKENTEEILIEENLYIIS